MIHAPTHAETLRFARRRPTDAEIARHAPHIDADIDGVLRRLPPWTPAREVLQALGLAGRSGVPATYRGSGPLDVLSLSPYAMYTGESLASDGSAWNDLSGNAHHVSQSDITKRYTPILDVRGGRAAGRSNSVAIDGGQATTVGGSGASSYYDLGFTLAAPCTVVDIYRSWSDTRSGNSGFSTNTGAGGIGIIAEDAAKTHWAIFNSSGSATVSSAQDCLPWRVRQVITTGSGAGLTTLRTDGKEESVTGVTGSTGRMGGYPTTTTNMFDGDRLCTILFNRALNSTERAYVDAWAVQQYGGRNYVVGLGNSILAGYKTSGGAHVPFNIARVAASSTFPWDGVNVSVTNRTLTQIYTKAALSNGANGDWLRRASFPISGGNSQTLNNKRHIALILEGHNEMYSVIGNKTAAQAHATLTSLVTQLHADGFYVAVYGCLPSAVLDFTTQVSAYNDLCVASNGGGADAWRDPRVDTLIGASGANLTSYYDADGIHPNDSGAAILGPALAALLSPLLV